MRKYNFEIVILLFLLYYCLIASIHLARAQSTATPIQAQGRIVYDEHFGLILKYDTDFEDVTKIDDSKLSLTIEHSFEFGGDGGASIWIEGMDRQDGATPHSGTRCVGMELTDVTKSRRCEFNLQHMMELVGDEVYVSVWLYLPSDWALHGSGWNWYAIANPFFDYNPPNYIPYTEIHINQPNVNIEKFDVEVMGRDVNFNRYTIDTVSNFPLPRGRWFNLEWYLYRHETNGKLRVWFDGQLISDRSGLTTKFTDDYLTCVGKIYHDTSDTTTHQIWVDDLEIYGSP
jgi:hypothetical protein